MTKLQSINPFSEEINAEFETIDETLLDKKIETAHKVYLKWKYTDTKIKKNLFLNLALELEKDIDECARLETIEMWMLNHISKEGLKKTIWLIIWFANNFENILEEKNYESMWMKVKEIYDPIWVIFWIAPWNFPFNQLLRAAVPNILAWNTQLYKHSSNVPLIALKIEDLFKKAWFEEWIYTNLFVNSNMSEDIISNKYIAWVNITGSEKAWSSIWSLAWKYLKPSVLELWWNDALLVLEDSDIEKAINFSINWRMRNGWQACNASKRFLIPSSIYELFLEKYTKAMSNLVIWDPMDKNTQVQPLASKKAIEEIQEQILRAVSTWAEIKTWWKILEKKWFFFPPTVLANVTRNTSSFNEEIFWPVASIIKYNNLEEAIELVNANDFWLSAVIIWNNEKEAIEIWKQIEWWMIFINQNASSKASLAFGWVKKSWYWKENWPDWLKAFTNKKLIVY